ncbi:MAG: bacteriohopanetetrol glucosamine biosynthesis glycosyltransferase HpnI [Candidatus Omnitrophica bacterium]|nr:bacteriohopanetetrol glucosamine biosynthesis glycosyltransferase HpnI [Candidatus Omnitrophota bacterium]
MSWIKVVLCAVLMIPCLSAIWFYCCAISGARDLFSGAREREPDFWPPVTILKPLCGLDSDAYVNLASFCRQDYSEYQILFGVRDRGDPSVEVVEQIIRDFPQRDVRLVVDNRMLGASPKVSNLANMEKEAKHPFLLISDGDIRVGEDYLKRVVQPMRDSRVGAVTCMHRSLSKGWAATIEALRISTDFCAGLLVARKLEGVKFTLGSTALVRKEALDKIGGFPAFADYLVDDFMLGNLVGKAGYTVVLSDYVVEHALTTRTLPDLIRREIRWNRGMRVSRPWGYLGLIFTQGIPVSLFFLLWAARSVFGWTMLAATWSARLAMAHIVGFRYLKDRAARKYLWLVPVSDLIGFVPWCYSLIGNTVDWRGQRFRLTSLGKLVPVPAGPPIMRRWDVHPALLAPLFAVILLVGMRLNQPTLFVKPLSSVTASIPLVHETIGDVKIVRLPKSDGIETEIPPPPLLSTSDRPVRISLSGRAIPVLRGIWSHLDIVGGVSSFGVLALTDGAFERDESRLVRDRDLSGAARTALLVAWGLGLWKQYRGPSALAPLSSEESWQFHVHPAIEIEENRMSMMATFKRRF